ncbi:MAG: succinate dehydrogenase/fumarate reductase iron-sulfur subunit [Candidatus Peregrinibacteria bacterium]|nr:succinate dehydrogenase/fumarate reductase iron-sulfur subunit [Candidatus Peregrinibacteria bacterium]
MSSKTYTFRVKRYRPDHGNRLQLAPHYVDYEVKGDHNMTLLDGLTKIQDEQDATLSFRWSCRMGICGSDGMLVNGRPVLACSVYCKDVERDGVIAVDPMRNMPIIKDLITDIDGPMDKMRAVMPYTDKMEAADLADGPTKQMPHQRERIKKTSQCIKCMLCYSACPVYGQDKNFVGPAAAALAYRYTADTRDDKGTERIDQVIGKENSVWGCSFVGECSVACPKRVDPAQAVQRLKVMGAMRIATKPLTDLIKKKSKVTKKSTQKNR